jgi:hypothetical protein
VVAARDIARASHAQRTQESYARWWADFTQWCADKGLASLPAAPETVAVWTSALVVGEGGRKPLARSSINQPAACGALEAWAAVAGLEPR